MGKSTITFLLLILVVALMKTSSSKSTIEGQRIETNNHEFTKLFKRSSHGKGKGTVRCNDHSECPEGYACLLPGFSKTSSKANKKCYECGCKTYSQCYLQHKSMFCNCSGSGFTGKFCQINIDDCLPTPCNNNGTCTDQVNGYTCQCNAGYTGSQCEIDIDDCENAICLNGGSCIDGVNEYHCQCGDYYTGADCGTSIDCKSSPCNVQGAKCTDVGNGYTCTCDIGEPKNITELNAISEPAFQCSPGFGTGGYNYYTSIQWKIIASVGETIFVTFTDFKTEKNYDFVIVQDGLVNGVKTCLAILSGGPPYVTIPQTLVSSTNELTVTFTSDNYNNDIGFCFTYSV